MWVLKSLEVIILGKHTTRIKKNSTTMLAISIASVYLCLHKKIKENINGRAIFVIVMVEPGASFFRIFDRQNVPASDISKNRPIWTWISMKEI